MYVSVEVITMLATAAATLVTIVSGFGWMITRMDARFEAQDVKLELRFDRIDRRFERVDERFERIDERFERIDERFDRVDQRLRLVELEMTEVKIAVARLEGPTPRLMRLADPCGGQTAEAQNRRGMPDSMPFMSS